MHYFPFPKAFKKVVPVLLFPLVTIATDVEFKLDPTCTAKEFEALKTKQNCLLRPGQDDSCLIGTMTQAMQGSPVAKANLGYLFENLPAEVRSKLFKVMDRFHELSRVPATSAPSATAIRAFLLTEGGSKDWERTMNTTSPRSILRQALSEEFPSELRKLENLRTEKTNALFESRKAHEARGGAMGANSVAEQAIEKAYAIKEADLIKQNPKIKLLSQLMDGASAFNRTLESVKVAQTLEAIAKEDKSKTAQARVARETAFIDDRYPIERENLVRAASRKNISSRLSSSAKSTAGNAALLGAAVFGGSLYATVVDRSRLLKCQGHFDFSPQEVDYLKDGSFYSLRVKTSDDCKDFGLFSADPMLEYATLLKKFKGVPKGICKMVQDQLVRLTALSPEAKISKSSCASGEISGNGFKIVNDEKSKRVVRLTTSAGQEYSVPWNDKDFYADFSNAGSYGTENAESKKRQKQLGSLWVARTIKYGDGSGGNYVLPAENDLLAPCDDATFCELRQRVATARTAVIQQKMICETFTQQAAAAPAAAAGAVGHGQ